MKIASLIHRSLSWSSVHSYTLPFPFSFIMFCSKQHFLFQICCKRNYDISLNRVKHLYEDIDTCNASMNEFHMFCKNIGFTSARGHLILIIHRWVLLNGLPVALISEKINILVCVNKPCLWKKQKGKWCFSLRATEFPPSGLYASAEVKGESSPGFQCSPSLDLD